MMLIPFVSSRIAVSKVSDTFFTHGFGASGYTPAKHAQNLGEISDQPSLDSMKQRGPNRPKVVMTKSEIDLANANGRKVRDGSTTRHVTLVSMF